MAAPRPRAPPEAVKELAPTGKLRAAINYGNPVLAQPDAATGQPRGVSVDLARELGVRLGVPVELVTFDAAGKVFDALGSGAWDVAFIAIDPARSAEIDFTAPYVVIEGTYLVPVNSPLRSIADVDREGVRIAVGNKSAYDLYLSRTLKRAHARPHADFAGGRRAVREGEARGGGRSEAAPGRIREDEPERARDGRTVHGDRAGDGHATGP